MDSSSSTAAIFKRKENWNSLEVRTLVQAVTDNLDILTSKLSMSVTAERKSKCWEAVTARVNCVSTTLRTVKEVKKKWQTFQSSVKSKEAQRLKERNGTGGGPSPKELTESEKVALAVIPTSMISGISGGIESDSLCTSNGAEEVCALDLERSKNLAGTGDAVETGKGKKRKIATVSSCVDGDDYQSKLLRIEQRRLDIEEERLVLYRQQVEAVKQIAEYFQSKHVQSLLNF